MSKKKNPRKDEHSDDDTRKYHTNEYFKSGKAFNDKFEKFCSEFGAGKGDFYDLVTKGNKYNPLNGSVSEDRRIAKRFAEEMERQLKEFYDARDAYADCT